MALHPNRAHRIYKTARDPKWKYSRVPLATGMIDAAISLHCGTFYGALRSELTKFAVIDIDEDSKYHNAQELNQLRETLAASGLASTCLYQSSRSSGWHLYIPLNDWAPSKQLEAALKALL